MKFIVLSLSLFALASAVPVTHLPGGLHHLDVHDARMLEALAHVQDDLNNQLNSPYFHRVGKVIKAESQVVAGIKYHVTFELGQTQCLKSKMTKETNLAECNAFANVQICEAKILSQPWLKHIRAEGFHCQPKQVPTFYGGVMTGGKHKMDVHDAHLLEILSEAQPKINEKLASQYFHRIGKVLSAESQVVSGIMYHLTLELGQTQCLKSKVTKDTNLAECNAFAHVQTCQVHILSQPWLKNLEVTSLHCGVKAQTHVEPVDHIAGGKHKMDVHDAHLLEALTTVQPQINDKLASQYFHRIGKVLSAESQVVSGVMYHVSFELGQTQCLKSKMTKETNLAECNAFANVQICHAKIWSQPWLKHTEVSDIKCEARKVETFYEEHKAGGLHQIDAHDATLLKTLAEVESQMNDKVKSDLYFRFGKVILAHSQVVSGTMYHVTLEIGATECQKSKVTKDNVASCHGFSHVQVCKAKIWSQPWLHHTEITDIQCHEKDHRVEMAVDVPTPHDIPGGKHLLDVNNKEMLAALHAVQTRMNNQLNSPFFHQIVKITEASSQVVSGIIYHVKFDFGQTKCTKTHIELDGCHEITKTHHCHADILVQSWLNKIELSKFHCDN